MYTNTPHVSLPLAYANTEYYKYLSERSNETYIAAPQARGWIAASTVGSLVYIDTVRASDGSPSDTDNVR